MKHSFPFPIRIPVVAVLCALVFVGYGLGGSPTLSLICAASAGPMADPAGLTGQTHCQVRQERRWGWLPPQTTELTGLDIGITSRLCDNTPRGGVRFCHRLTLLGDQGSVTLPEIRTPLSAQQLTDRLTQLMTGQGGDRLVWRTTRHLTNLLSTLAIGILLAITAWGLWDVQWPPSPPLPPDGEATSKRNSKKC